MAINGKFMASLQLVARIIIASVLLFAGVTKLMDNTALFETVTYITWLPVWMKSLIISYMPWFEILLAALLLIYRQSYLIKGTVFLIFFGFLGFAAYGYATGLEGDCGCFGDLADSSFGWGMIFRNVFFVALAGLLFYKPENSKETVSE